MSSYYFPPLASGGSSGSNASVGPNGDPIVTSSTLIAGTNATGDQTPILVDAAGAQSVNVLTSALPTGAATESTLQNVVDAIGNLETGIATENKQDDQITLQTAANLSLDNLDDKTPALGQALAAASVPVVLTAAQLTTLTPIAGGATEATLAALAAEDFATETTLEALSDKSASALITAPYDYQAITYIGSTTDIDTVVFKSGGAGGTTVGTLTMGYDGSNRLTSVTKS